MTEGKKTHEEPPPTTTTNETTTREKRRRDDVRQGQSEGPRKNDTFKITPFEQEAANNPGIPPQTTGCAAPDI